MAKKRESTYKPLLFTTTVRNPERMKRLLNVLSKFDGEVLTSELAENIIAELIKYGVYRPMKISNSVKEKWSTSKKSDLVQLEKTEFLPPVAKKFVFFLAGPSKIFFLLTI